MWNDADIERASTSAETILGRSGRIITSRTGVVDVVLVTMEHGKVWYGQLNLMDKSEVERLMKFSRSLEMAVYVFDAEVAERVGGKYLDVTDAIAMVKGSDIQIIQSRYAMA